MTTTANEVWQILGELIEAWKEADHQIKETAQEQKEIDHILKANAQLINYLCEKFEGFTEGLALPSMETILQQ